MKPDQNRIELRLSTAVYEECILRSNEGTSVLPGSLLIFEEGYIPDPPNPIRPNYGYANVSYSAPNYQKVIESVPYMKDSDDHFYNSHLISEGLTVSPYRRFVYTTSYEIDEDNPVITHESSIHLFPAVVVIENALLGKGLNHVSNKDELLLCRTLGVSNEYLLRAVPGHYDYGDVVYAVQTKSNGIWVCNSTNLAFAKTSGILDSDAVLGMRVGTCLETYDVTKEMCEYVDSSTPNTPTPPCQRDARDIWNVLEPNTLSSSDCFYSGIRVNLIKVRTFKISPDDMLPAISGITFTSNGGTFVYDGVDHPTTEYITVTGAEATDTIIWSVNGTVSENPKLKNVGDYQVGVRVRRAGHHDLTHSVSVSITKKQLTVTGTSAADKTYDGTTAAAVTVGTVSGIAASDSGLVVSGSGTFVSANAGDDVVVNVVYTVPAEYAGNYLAPVSETVTADIAKKEVAVASVSLDDKVYDGTTNADFVLGEVTGILAGDDAEVIATGAFSSKNVGTYNVAVSYDLSGSKAGSYVVTTLGTSLPADILAKEVEVVGTVVQDKEYDGTTTATITTGTLSGAISGDDVSVSASGSFSSADVGDYNVLVSYTLSGTDSGNYDLDPTSETLAASITPATITGITVTDYSGTYDGTSHGVGVSGQITGDTTTYSSDNVTFGATPVTINFGEQTVYVKVSRANHNDWTGSGDIDITPKTVTISGTTVADKKWTGTTHADITVGSITSGLLPADVGAVFPVGTGAFPSPDEGTYNVVVSYTFVDSSDDPVPYYQASPSTHEASITPGDPFLSIPAKYNVGSTLIAPNSTHTIPVDTNGTPVKVAIDAEDPTVYAASLVWGKTYATKAAVDAFNARDPNLMTDTYLTSEGYTSYPTTSDIVLHAGITTTGTYYFDIKATETNYRVAMLGSLELVVMDYIPGLSAGHTTHLADGEYYTFEVTGLQEGDQVSYTYGTPPTTTSTKPSFNLVGDYIVQVTVTRSGYYPTTVQGRVTLTDSYTYTASANGSPGGTGFNAVTTTAITLTFTGDDIPSSIPLSDLVVGGDAVTTATSAISVSDNKAIIPIRVTKTEGAESYSANVTLDSGNTDTGVKQVPIYFVPCYWGAYPCHLGGSVTPSATQILEMADQHVILGTKFTGGVPITFALNEDNWDKEVLLNGITGDDADFVESGCGYCFFINSWGVGKSGIASFTNPSGDNQLPAFDDFTLAINGVQYKGIVTAACSVPSGTTPFTITLS